MIEMAYFLGMATSMLWMTYLSDKLGRKIIVLPCVMLNLLFQIILLSTKNQALLTITIFLLGVLFPANFDLIYIYLYELLPEKS